MIVDIAESEGVSSTRGTDQEKLLEKTPEATFDVRLMDGAYFLHQFRPGITGKLRLFSTKKGKLSALFQK